MRPDQVRTGLALSFRRPFLKPFPIPFGLGSGDDALVATGPCKDGTARRPWSKCKATQPAGCKTRQEPGELWAGGRSVPGACGFPQPNLSRQRARRATAVWLGVGLCGAVPPGERWQMQRHRNAKVFRRAPGRHASTCQAARVPVTARCQRRAGQGVPDSCGSDGSARPDPRGVAR